MQKTIRLDYSIGIDTGTNTGLAVWNVKAQRFDVLITTQIHKAFPIVKRYHDEGFVIRVIVEDARQVKFNTSSDKAQGAGYVKAHAQIWEAFLEDFGIPFEMKRPEKKKTKLDTRQFQMMTGYTGLTSNHARDSGMLVYRYDSYLDVDKEPQKPKNKK